MNKFKIGDRVVVVRNVFGTDNHIGARGTVVGTEVNGLFGKYLCHVKKDNNDTLYFSDAELESENIRTDGDGETDDEDLAVVDTFEYNDDIRIGYGPLKDQVATVVKTIHQRNPDAEIVVAQTQGHGTVYFDAAKVRKIERGSL